MAVQLPHLSRDEGLHLWHPALSDRSRDHGKACCDGCMIPMGTMIKAVWEWSRDLPYDLNRRHRSVQNDGPQNPHHPLMVEPAEIEVLASRHAHRRNFANVYEAPLEP